MPDLALDLRYLKYAILAAENGSFRRTAELLNVPQSTVTRRIQLLEHRVGIALFERSRKGARVTAAGEAFLKEAGIGAEHLQRAVDRVSLVKRGHSGRLCIGLMASLGQGFLAELLGGFHDYYPDIEIILEEATSQINASGVLSGRLDAAFIPGDPILPGCRSQRLWNEKIYAALPDGFEPSSPSLVTWNELRNENFLVTADAAGPEVEAHLVRRISSSGFRPRISVQRVGRENLLNMVARGFGVTLTTSSTMGVSYPGIRFLPVDDRDDTVSSSAVWSTTNRNPALENLMKFTTEHARRASEVA